MERFSPEGILINPAENSQLCSSLSGLSYAMRRRTVLQAVVTICDREHDLTVKLGDVTGIIPHSEAALGLDDGSTREIAVISRVGKPTSFIVTELTTDEQGQPLALLSRKQAQKMALEAISALPPGQVLPAVVANIASFGAFVDIGCGLTSMIPLENISVARISSPAERFYPGQHIFALLLGVQGDRVLLSHKQLLGTWQENAARFSAGETVSGIVRGVKDYGIFVELTPNLSGLAEYRRDVSIGDSVSVYIKSIVPERQKIKLVIIDRLERPLPCRSLQYCITQGIVTDWDYNG